MSATVVLAHGDMMTADEIIMISVGIGFFLGLPILALLFVLAKRRRDGDVDEDDGSHGSAELTAGDPHPAGQVGRHETDRGWR